MSYFDSNMINTALFFYEWGSKRDEGYKIIWVILCTKCNVFSNLGTFNLKIFFSKCLFSHLIYDKVYF